MVEQWKAELSGSEQMVVMVNKWLSRATLDIIGQGMLTTFLAGSALIIRHEAAFDYDYGALDGPNSSPLNKAYDNLL